VNSTRTRNTQPAPLIPCFCRCKTHCNASMMAIFLLYFHSFPPERYAMSFVPVHRNTSSEIKESGALQIPKQLQPLLYTLPKRLEVRFDHMLPSVPCRTFCMTLNLHRVPVHKISYSPLQQICHRPQQKPTAPSSGI
jgi:hypothetical protein